MKAMQEPQPDFSCSAYLFPRIHPEGKRFGLCTLLLTLAVAAVAAVGGAFWAPLAWLGVFTGPLLLLTVGGMLFFRDPDRYPPADPAAVLSPADGRVCLIREVPLPAELLADAPVGLDPAARYTRVSVFMSVFNVHINRMPTAGRILKKVATPGRFLNAALDKASSENERCAYLIETPAGARYGVVQIAGLVAKRIVPFVDAGATLAAAERFGLIRFGSRLDVYLPPGVKPAVREGQIMVAGETILGRL